MEFPDADLLSGNILFADFGAERPIEFGGWTWLEFFGTIPNNYPNSCLFIN